MKLQMKKSALSNVVGSAPYWTLILSANSKNTPPFNAGNITNTVTKNTTCPTTFPKKQMYREREGKEPYAVLPSFSR